MSGFSFPCFTISIIKSSEQALISNRFKSFNSIQINFYPLPITDFSTSPEDLINISKVTADVLHNTDVNLAGFISPIPDTIQFNTVLAILSQNFHKINFLGSSIRASNINSIQNTNSSNPYLAFSFDLDFYFFRRVSTDKMQVLYHNFY